MYHHILEKERDDPYVISPAQFKNDMKILKERGFTAVSPQEVVDFVENGVALPKKPILITFDDGYESVYKYAYPVLKEYELKATALVIGHFTDLFSTDTTKNITYSNLSWDQLKEMQESGVFTVGNHSYNLHIGKGQGSRYGTTKKPDESVEEYFKSVGGDLLKLNEGIKKNLGNECITFAYPFGAISKELKPFLAENFKIIFTCDARVNKLTPNMEEPIILRRFNRDREFSSWKFFNQFSSIK